VTNILRAYKDVFTLTSLALKKIKYSPTTKKDKPTLGKVIVWDHWSIMDLNYGPMVPINYFSERGLVFKCHMTKKVKL